MLIKSYVLNVKPDFHTRIIYSSVSLNLEINLPIPNIKSLNKLGKDLCLAEDIKLKICLNIPQTHFSILNVKLDDNECQYKIVNKYKLPNVAEFLPFNNFDLLSYDKNLIKCNKNHGITYLIINIHKNIYLTKIFDTLNEDFDELIQENINKLIDIHIKCDIDFKMINPCSDESLIYFTSHSYRLGNIFKEFNFILTTAQEEPTRAWFPCLLDTKEDIKFIIKFQIPIGLIALASGKLKHREIKDDLEHFEYEFYGHPSDIGIFVGDFCFIRKNISFENIKCQTNIITIDMYKNHISYSLNHLSDTLKYIYDLCDSKAPIDSISFVFIETSFNNSFFRVNSVFSKYYNMRYINIGNIILLDMNILHTQYYSYDDIMFSKLLISESIASVFFGFWLRCKNLKDFWILLLLRNFISVRVMLGYFNLLEYDTIIYRYRQQFVKLVEEGYDDVPLYSKFVPKSFILRNFCIHIKIYLLINSLSGMFVCYDWLPKDYLYVILKQLIEKSLQTRFLFSTNDFYSSIIKEAFEFLKIRGLYKEDDKYDQIDISDFSITANKYMYNFIFDIKRWFKAYILSVGCPSISIGFYVALQKKSSTIENLYGSFDFDSIEPPYDINKNGVTIFCRIDSCMKSAVQEIDEDHLYLNKVEELDIDLCHKERNNLEIICRENKNAFGFGYVGNDISNYDGGFGVLYEKIGGAESGSWTTSSKEILVGLATDCASRITIDEAFVAGSKYKYPITTPPKSPEWFENYIYKEIFKCNNDFTTFTKMYIFEAKELKLVKSKMIKKKSLANFLNDSCSILSIFSGLDKLSKKPFKPRKVAFKNSRGVCKRWCGALVLEICEENGMTKTHRDVRKDDLPITFNIKTVKKIVNQTNLDGKVMDPNRNVLHSMKQNCRFCGFTSKADEEIFTYIEEHATMNFIAQQQRTDRRIFNLKNIPLIWIRFDPDTFWIGRIERYQSLSMWEQQLENESNVKLQIESVEALGTLRKFNVANKILRKAMRRFLYHPYVRVSAVKSLKNIYNNGSMEGEIVLKSLFNYYIAVHCKPKSGFTFSQIKTVDDVIPKRITLSFHPEVLFLRGYLNEISKLRDISGYTPEAVINLLLLPLISEDHENVTSSGEEVGMMLFINNVFETFKNIKFKIKENEEEFLESILSELYQTSSCSFFNSYFNKFDEHFRSIFLNSWRLYRLDYCLPSIFSLHARTFFKLITRNKDFLRLLRRKYIDENKIDFDFLYLLPLSLNKLPSSKIRSLSYSNFTRKYYKKLTANDSWSIYMKHMCRQNMHYFSYVVHAEVLKSFFYLIITGDIKPNDVFIENVYFESNDEIRFLIVDKLQKEYENNNEMLKSYLENEQIEKLADYFNSYDVNYINLLNETYKYFNEQKSQTKNISELILRLTNPLLSKWQTTKESIVVRRLGLGILWCIKFAINLKILLLHNECIKLRVNIWQILLEALELAQKLQPDVFLPFNLNYGKCIRPSQLRGFNKKGIFKEKKKNSNKNILREVYILFIKEIEKIEVLIKWNLKSDKKLAKKLRRKKSELRQILQILIKNKSLRQIVQKKRRLRDKRRKENLKFNEIDNLVVLEINEIIFKYLKNQILENTASRNTIIFNIREVYKLLFGMGVPQIYEKLVEKYIIRRPPTEIIDHRKRSFTGFNKMEKIISFKKKCLNGSYILKDWEVLAKQITNLLINHSAGVLFKSSINLNEAPDYYKVVDRPVWLNYILSNLNNKLYKKCDDWVIDIFQIFHNCRIYNKPNSEIINESDELQRIFVDLLSSSQLIKV